MTLADVVISLGVAFILGGVVGFWRAHGDGETLFISTLVFTGGFCVFVLGGLLDYRRLAAATKRYEP